MSIRCRQFSWISCLDAASDVGAAELVYLPHTSRIANDHCHAATVANAPTGACQINDVFVDDRGVVFCVDRHVGGLYALEMDF